MTDRVECRREDPDAEGQTFFLCVGFLGAAIASWWLGLLISFVTGTVPSDPPLFPGKYLAAALLASSLLAFLIAYVWRTDGNRRDTALCLLFTAAFAVLNVLCVLYFLTSLGTLCILPSPNPVEASAGLYRELAVFQSSPECRPVPVLTASPVFWAAMTPAALAAALLCLAAAWRSAFLQLASVAAGCLFAFAGLLLSLAQALT